MEKKDQYPEVDYQKSIFSFNNTELSNLCSWDTQIQLGIVAQRIVESIIKSTVMKRVGIKVNLDTRWEYDTSTGRFVVYQPRNICSSCSNRMAKFSYANKLYCQPCIELLKQEAAKIKPSNSKKSAVLKEPPKVG